MLRLTLHLVLAAASAVGPASDPPDQPAADCRDSDTLYDEGLKEYNQKAMKAAVAKFEEAHRCSNNPLILYNVGLAYQRLYQDEQEVAQLESAKKALVAYVAAIKRDPTLGADPEEVRPILAEIEAELERVKPPEPEPTPEPPPVVEVQDDPGRPRRLLGTGLMSGGGALTVIGVAVSAAFASKGADLKDELNGEGGVYPQLVAGGCGAVAEDDPAGADAGECDALRGMRDDLKSDGKRANAVAIGMAAVGAVGVGLLIGGAVTFIKGKRATETWESSQRARVRVVPTFTGLSIEGRF